jgi:hypothetical protein
MEPAVTRLDFPHGHRPTGPGHNVLTFSVLAYLPAAILDGEIPLDFFTAHIDYPGVQ